MQAHEGIQDQQPWSKLGDGALERSGVGRQVQPQRRGGDHLDVEGLQVKAGRQADPFEPSAHDVQGVFGRIQQHAARVWHGELTQTRRAGSHRHSQLEREEGLAAFGLPADDADGLFRPQSCDEPTLLIRASGQLPGQLHRQRAHRLRPATLSCAAEGAATVSKNSCSSIWRASR